MGIINVVQTIKEVHKYEVILVKIGKFYQVIKGIKRGVFFVVCLCRKLLTNRQNFLIFTLGK